MLQISWSKLKKNQKIKVEKWRFFSFILNIILQKNQISEKKYLFENLRNSKLKKCEKIKVEKWRFFFANIILGFIQTLIGKIRYSPSGLSVLVKVADGTSSVNAIISHRALEQMLNENFRCFSEDAVFFRRVQISVRN